MSCSSIDFLLTRKGIGNMLILVPGGVEECNYSMPYSCTIFLKNRYGFVNKALQHGSGHFCSRLGRRVPKVHQRRRKGF